MATKYVYFGESTSRSRNQTVYIPNLGLVTSVTVDTGSVSHSVSGNNVTIYVNNGTATRTYEDSVYRTNYRTSTNPSTFPLYLDYNDGTYSGRLEQIGGYYIDDWTDPIPAYKTGNTSGSTTSRFTWNGNSWSRTSTWYSPTSIIYDDGTYYGTLDTITGASQFAPFPPLSAGQGQASGYTTTRSTDALIYYEGTVYTEIQPIYRQDYAGYPYQVIYYYQYNVAINYLSPFAWASPKISGENFNLKATEWNSLLYRIGQYRQYKGYGFGSYTTVEQQWVVKADYYNEAVNNLATISGNTPPHRQKDDTIKADDLNQLRNALNNVT